MNNAFFGKTMKMLENIDISSFSQHKEEETVQCQNEIITL